MVRDIHSYLMSWWGDHHKAVLRLAVAVMTVAAFVWLGYQFWRLLWPSSPIWPSSPTGATDLKVYHQLVHDWFAGKPVDRAFYPPASYAILWPLLGWLAVTPARWLWGATTVMVLAWFAYLIVQESAAKSRLERMFVALMLLSIYATGATIGNGQLIVHLLPALLSGLLLLHRGRGAKAKRRVPAGHDMGETASGRDIGETEPDWQAKQSPPRPLAPSPLLPSASGWGRDLLAAALIVVALVEPAISVPFLWLLLFLPGRARPAFLVSLGYIGLTLFAALFQKVTLASLFGYWLSIGSGEWLNPFSLFVLAILGFWSYRHRHVDLWILLGVTALVARFWTSHYWYNDLLILLPMVTLFRLAKRERSTDSGNLVAGVLLACTMLTMLAPGGLYLFPAPWNKMYVVGQKLIWIVMLIFLLDRARRENAVIQTGRQTASAHVLPFNDNVVLRRWIQLCRHWVLAVVHWPPPMAIAILLGFMLPALSLEYFSTPYGWIFLSWFLALMYFVLISKKRVIKFVCLNVGVVLLTVGLFEISLSKALLDIPEAFSPQLFTHSDILGHALLKESTATASKEVEGELLYEVVHTIDGHGLRIPPPHEANSRDCILFFGGSFTFGAGVQDDEAMPYQVGVKSGGRYQIYNFGVNGYGPHQMLAALEHGLVDDIIDCEPKYAIYQAIFHHIPRVAGFTHEHGPRYVLCEACPDDQQVRFAGDFSDYNFNTLFDDWQIYRNIRKNWGNSRPEVDLFLGIVAKSRDIIQTRYPSSEFHVLIWDNEGSPDKETVLRELKAQGIPLYYISAIIPDVDQHPAIYRLAFPYDWHPSARAHELIAEYVVSEIIRGKP